MTTPNENGQGQCALRELFYEAMKLAGAGIALAEDYSGGESETASYLSQEYDKLNSKFDIAIDKRNAMHNAIVSAKVSASCPADSVAMDWQNDFESFPCME